MGCVSYCKYSAICAIAADNAANIVDWANHGAGMANENGISVTFACGPLGNYQMFQPTDTSGAAKWGD